MNLPRICLSVAICFIVCGAVLWMWMSHCAPWQRTGQAPGPSTGEGGTIAAAAPPSEPHQESLPPLPDQTIDALRAVIAPYQQVHDLLARDALVGLDRAGMALDRALQSAVTALPAVRPVDDRADCLVDAAAEAKSLAVAPSLDDARHHFAGISRCLVGLIGSVPALRDGLTVFRCPMTTGYKKWFQTTPKMVNPYMGQAMAACGSPSTWSDDAQPAATSRASVSDIAYYTCSMHPSVRQAGPGTCPICSMDLVPVTKQQVASGEVIIDVQRRQVLGIRTEAVVEAPMAVTLRTAGRVTADDAAISEVSLKVGGWVTDIAASRLGAVVRKGQPLFSLYSPEVYDAEQELLLVARRETAVGGDGADALLRAARERLRRWDIADDMIDAMLRSGAAPRSVVIAAPASGYVLEKDIMLGSGVLPGQRLYRIADLSHVWVMADLFETDLASVKAGQAAIVSLTFAQGKTFAGTIDYVYPYLNAGTRTAQARIVLDNPDLSLRPEMYATVTITIDLGRRLQVPKSAVLYTGPRRLVFIDRGGGYLLPRPITIGKASDTTYEVLSGLKAGEQVVSSGNFLVAAESRIISAEKYWGGDDAGK